MSSMHKQAHISRHADAFFFSRHPLVSQPWAMHTDSFFPSVTARGLHASKLEEAACILSQMVKPLSANNFFPT